ncbi:MAG: hypothetical protein ACP5JU_02910 [Minisyncoccia bacterium]
MVDIVNVSYEALANLISNINNILPYVFYSVVLVSIASLFLIAYVIYEFVRRK